MAGQEKKIGLPGLPVSLIAASVNDEKGPDILSALDTFKSIQQAPQTRILKGTEQQAHIRFSRPAYGRSNVGARRLFVEAADAHHLPSPRFEALYVKFSDPLQALLCVPLPEFKEGEPDTLQVTWSKDGSEMRCDFAEVLIPKNWATPKRMTRKARAYLYTDLPGYGAAVLVVLRDSVLEEVNRSTSGAKSGENPSGSGGTASA